MRTRRRCMTTQRAAIWSQLFPTAPPCLVLGNIGPLASKPVMEGKCVLFKRFADVDAINVEVFTEDVAEFVESVRLFGNTFGGINLEDIKAPECFMIEEQLRELLDVPVFHDDQHGTAIITAAGLINAIALTGRDLIDGTDRHQRCGRCIDCLCRPDQSAWGSAPTTSSCVIPRASSIAGREDGDEPMEIGHAVGNRGPHPRRRA